MNKLFIVTGATSGLGKALVDLLLINTQYSVLSLSRRRCLEHESYSNFNFILLDLSEGLSEAAKLKLTNHVEGKQIIFINNAATIYPISKIGTFSDNEISNSISVNLLSPIKLINFLLSVILPNNIQFVNISSGAADRAIDSWSLYCTTKSAMKMFFQNIDIEYKDCIVHNLDPGVMDTDMQEYIRGREFDSVEMFISLSEKKLLKDVSLVAKDILIDFL